LPSERASVLLIVIQVGVAILCHTASTSGDERARKMSGIGVSEKKLPLIIFIEVVRGTLSRIGAGWISIILRMHRGDLQNEVARMSSLLCLILQGVEILNIKLAIRRMLRIALTAKEIK